MNTIMIRSRTTLKSKNIQFMNRLFSTPQSSGGLTPEQVKKEVDKVNRFRKFVSPSLNLNAASLGAGTGKELHVPKNLSDLAALTGMPAEQANRTVLITQRVRKSQQSNHKFAHLWEIKWKQGHRWTNPLMGWTSGNDPMDASKLSFDTKEDAINFADKHGWKYEIKSEHVSRVVPAGTQTYADNFLPKKVLARMKDEGMKNQIFANPGYGASNWFMPLQYHGNAPVVQFGPPVKS